MAQVGIANLAYMYMKRSDKTIASFMEVIWESLATFVSHVNFGLFLLHVDIKGLSNDASLWKICIIQEVRI